MSAYRAPSDGVAIVTGASSGIGAEFARQLAARGHTVLAVARRADRLNALAREVQGRGGCLHALAIDLAAEGAARIIAERAAELGETTWLVNNAGITAFGTFAEQAIEPQMAMTRLHCEAMVALTGAVLPGMLARRRGVVLNVASIAGFMATPFMAVYGASKAFVLSFSEGLREELAHTSVSVTVLCPGPVSTEIYEVGAPKAPRSPPSHEMSPAACARFAIDAAVRGRLIAIPGLRNRFDVMSAMLAPRALVRWILRVRGLSYLGYSREALKLPP
jgi:short-subunit dehydrogenase